MARRRKTRKSIRKPRRPGWWASLDGERRRSILRRGAALLFTVGVAAFAWVGLKRVEADVERQLLSQVTGVTLVFPDLPESLESLAWTDLNETVSDLLTRAWTDDQLCRDIAKRLSEVGWISQIHFVRRTSDGRVEVSARYRLPFAMVQQEDRFLLLDEQAVRLPGTFRYSPTWKLIQGVAAAAPPAGSIWQGRDVRAGLDVIAALANQPFAEQVTAVLVENTGGRVNPARSHIVLATDQAGGRILWGSAPGHEIEENTVEQKLAILRANYDRTGRVDAEHAVIDVSTFPDHFTVPG